MLSVKQTEDLGGEVGQKREGKKDIEGSSRWKKNCENLHLP